MPVNPGEVVHLEIKIQEIRESVLRKYRRTAECPNGLFPYKTGRDGLRALGYDVKLVEALPESVSEYFCGVGNPFAIGPVSKGDAILDVGCGGGVDLIIAANLTGLEGKAVGLDLTEEMVARAEENIARTGVLALVVKGEAEELPFPAEVFDLVISNGVINLSPAKDNVFSEIFRILKRGGRLQFADIVLAGTLPQEQALRPEAWSN